MVKPGCDNGRGACRIAPPGGLPTYQPLSMAMPDEAKNIALLFMVAVMLFVAWTRCTARIAEATHRHDNAVHRAN